ncbi:MAG TPA: hypothetical protein PKZ32_11115 [Candidatus Melainabacteria bacterium]|nr:hypothetical protein [Candidatus Melainabacteria bacterium]
MIDSPKTLFWVNKRPVDAEALRQLLLIEDDGAFLSQLVEESIAEAECDRRQIEADPKAVSEELNNIRRIKRLFSRADTEKWLQENGLDDSEQLQSV